MPPVCKNSSEVVAGHLVVSTFQQSRQAVAVDLSVDHSGSRLSCACFASVCGSDSLTHKMGCYQQKRRPRRLHFMYHHRHDLDNPNLILQPS